MINVASTSRHRFEGNETGFRLASFLKRVLASPVPLVLEWEKRISYRRDLSRILDTGSHLVLDIGLELDEALHEIGKPFYIE